MFMKYMVQMGTFSVLAIFCLASIVVAAETATGNIHCTDGGNVCDGRSTTVGLPAICAGPGLANPCTVNPGQNIVRRCACANNPQPGYGHLCFCNGS